MSEKKIAVGLGALSIVLVIALAGVVAYFSMFSNSLINSKESEINELVTTKSNLNSQVFDLQVASTDLHSQISDLEAANGHLNDQIKDLNAQIENLKAPCLVNVGLGAADEGTRPPFAPNLHVTGYVCNVGTNAAYNAKLHIVAYFASGATAIDTYLPLGNGIISGGTPVQVDLNVTYTRAGTLASWKMTPQWTNSP